ncbi:hypothetical protein ACFLV0_03235, partial [Chloroflexota bacterium]
EEFGVNAPINYREDTTSEAFLKGMTVITPPGMKPRASRGHKFEEKTDFKASTTWHRNFDIAMFGGSDVDAPGSESKQLSLEEKLNGINRVPGRK